MMGDSSNSEPFKKPLWRSRRAWIIGVVVGVLGLAAVADDGQGDEDQPAGIASVATTAPASPATTEEAEAAVELMTVTELLDPIDRAGYLDGIARREPALLAEVAEDSLVQFGVLACETRNGYVHGSRPSAVDQLADQLAGATGSTDVDDAASAIANAAQGPICAIEVVETS